MGWKCRSHHIRRLSQAILNCTCCTSVLVATHEFHMFVCQDKLHIGVCAMPGARSHPRGWGGGLSALLHCLRFEYPHFTTKELALSHDRCLLSRVDGDGRPRMEVISFLTRLPYDSIRCICYSCDNTRPEFSLSKPVAEEAQSQQPVRLAISLHS